MPKKSNRQNTKKKRARLECMEKHIGSLLKDDDELNKAYAKVQPQPNKSKRGPKIDENVMVKICDMGNGCWTYHQFTPEI